MSPKRKTKLVRQYWEAYAAYMASGNDVAVNATLQERFESAKAKLERNGIDLDDAHNYRYIMKVQNGWE